MSEMVTLPSGTQIPAEIIVRWMDGFMSESEMEVLSPGDWHYLKTEWMVDPIDA
jgi:hypothetical protein